MAKLIALTSIRADRGFHVYLPGDELPQDHPDAAAWLESGAAVLKEDDYQPKEWPKARLATAEPGRTGYAVGGEGTGDDLVGRVPMTHGRRRGRWHR